MTGGRSARRDAGDLQRSRLGLTSLACSLVIAASSPASAQESDVGAEPQPQSGAGDLPPTEPASPPIGAEPSVPPVAEPVAPGEYETIVRTLRVPTPIYHAATGTSVLDARDVQQGRPMLGLDESLLAVPGVFAQNRYDFAQGLRLSIRGFGARGTFGIRGIQVLQDGLPLTGPDGQTNVDSIDVGSISQLEVMRGPAASLYGNGAGGVVNVKSESAPPAPFVAPRMVIGSFGLRRLDLKGGGDTGTINYLVGVTRLTYRGFRARSRVEQTSFNGKLVLDPDERSKLTLVTSVLDVPRANNPGGLTKEEAAADPQRAAPSSLEFSTGESVRLGRLGLAWERQLSAAQTLSVSAQFISRAVASTIPRTSIDLARFLGFAGAQYRYEDWLLDRYSRTFVGFDVNTQLDRRSNFPNVDGVVQDSLTLHQREELAAIGAYAGEELWLTRRVALVASARYDHLVFDVDDLLESDGDDSGSRVFSALTGRGALVVKPAKEVSIYANAAQSFESPTTTEMVNRPGGGGGINADLEPQRGLTLEVGAHGRLIGVLGFEAALFSTSLRNELARFEDESSRAYYRNAGQSRRRGVELGLDLRPIDGLRARLAYTYLDADFLRFEKDGADLKGKAVPGLPPHVAGATLSYQSRLGVFVNADALRVSAFAVDDENTERTRPYALLNASAGYERASGALTFSATLGVQNVTDEAYSQNIRINASARRFYEPGPRRAYHGMLAVALRAE